MILGALPPYDGAPFSCSVMFIESHAKEVACGHESVGMFSPEDYDSTSEYRKMLRDNIGLVYTGRIVCQTHADLLIESAEREGGR